jgi:DNA-binding IclR family transcriptional regulator
MATSPDKQNDYAVRSVVRAARILELVRTSDGGAQLNELASRSGLAKASAFRLLRTLEHVGLIQRVPNSDLYRLGVRCLELGQTYLEQTDLRREATPVLQDLQRRFKETVHLGVLDDELRVVYLEKLETTHAIGIMMSRVGRTAPSHCTGLGKAMLASLDGDPATVLFERGELHRHTTNTICDRDALREELARIRKRGFAIDLEEHEVGVRCVASTIHAPREVAAISVAGPAQRLPERRLRRELAKAVIAAASEISRRLGSPQRGEAGDAPRR